MNRKDILEAASSAVHAQDAEHDYGKPENNFENIAKLWNAYLEALDCKHSELEARDVAVMMILLKIARAANSTKSDHWVDIAGYAACGGEIDGTPEEANAIEAVNDTLKRTLVMSDAIRSIGKEA